MLPTLQVESAFLFEPSAVTLSKIALAAVNTSYLSPTNFDIGSSRQLQVEPVLGVSLLYKHPHKAM